MHFHNMINDGKIDLSVCLNHRQQRWVSTDRIAQIQNTIVQRRRCIHSANEGPPAEKEPGHAAGRIRQQTVYPKDGCTIRGCSMGDL